MASLIWLCIVTGGASLPSLLELGLSSLVCEKEGGEGREEGEHIGGRKEGGGAYKGGYSTMLSLLIYV
jgi:hypothetical protein